MKKFNFALIGTGHIASRHFKIIEKIGLLQAIVDTDASKLEFWKQSYPVSCYANLDDLFENSPLPIDILVVCTPNGFHYQHVEKALLNNCHVICEKPLTIKTNEAILLQQIAAKQQKLLFTVQSMRYNPIIQLVKNSLQNRHFGKTLGFQMQCIWNRPNPYFSSFWKGTQSLDGGPLFTQFSHYIDVLQWFFGEIVDAQGVRQNLMHKDTIDFEDQGTAQITTTQFIHGSIFWSINAHLKNFEIGLTISCEQLTLKLGGPYLNEIVYCSDESFESQLKAAKNKIDPSQLSFHNEVYADFINILASHPHSHIDTDDAIKTIRSIETIYQSTPLI